MKVSSDRMVHSSPKLASALLAVVLAILGIAGAALILAITAPYGVGLSHDSVGYISAARNLALGRGLVQFDGTQVIDWAPLYPVLLGTFFRLSGIDPLPASRAVQALLFAAILVSSGYFFLRLNISRLLAVAGVAILAVSEPLVSVAVMAWSETLFILLSILFLIGLTFYLKQPRLGVLLLTAVFAALGCLTRYIGVSLVLTGALLILAFSSHRQRWRQLALFLVVSISPLAVWLARNYQLSGTLMGYRGASSYGLGDNLFFSYTTFLTWFVPPEITASAPRTLAFFILFVLLVLILLLYFRPAIVETTKQARVPILFGLVYFALLLYTSTTTAYDQIGTRLLIPLYVPLLSIVLVFSSNLLRAGNPRLGPVTVPLWLLIAVFLVLWWWRVPLRQTLNNTRQRMAVGTDGYASAFWQNSELIGYLLKHPLGAGALYSNDPSAVYILTGLVAANTPHREVPSARLPSYWAQHSPANVIWFNAVSAPYMYDETELQEGVRTQTVIETQDGAVFRFLSP